MARSAPRDRAAGGPAIDFGRPDDAVGKLLALALEEDVGPGDRTAEACVPSGASGAGLIVAKETLVVSGVSAAARVFRALAPPPSWKLSRVRGRKPARARACCASADRCAPSSPASGRR